MTTLEKIVIKWTDQHKLVSHPTNSLALLDTLWHKVFTGVGSNFGELGFQTAVALETNFFGTFDPFSRKYWHHKEKTDCYTLC